MLTTDFVIPQRPEGRTSPRFWNRVAQPARTFLRLRSQRGMQVWGYGAFLLISLLYASFYPVAKPALDRIDTTIFVALQMIWLVPPALFLLFWSQWQISWQALLHSVLLGSCMSAALFCLTWAIAFTSITETAMFSCMNGVLVIVVSWLFFRQHIPLFTWLACVCSGGGIVVLLSVSRMHWQGDLLAFLGGLLLTGYTFLLERLYFHPQPAHAPKRSLRAACGLEWLTMAGETLLIALLFGNWHSVHLFQPSDLLIFSYVGLATTLIPMLLMITMRRYVDGVLLTFLAILEPIADASFAFFFAHEQFLFQVYLGGILAIGSCVFQACAGNRGEPVLSLARVSFKKSCFFLFCKRPLLPANDGGKRLALRHHLPLGKCAPTLPLRIREKPDGGDLVTMHHLPGISCDDAYRFLVSLHKQGYRVLSHKTHEVPPPDPILPGDTHYFSEGLSTEKRLEDGGSSVKRFHIL